MPWPAKGGIWCAASPASSTRPFRQRSAQRARKVYTAWRSSFALLGRTPHGASRRHAAASLFSSSSVSCGRRMNSQRRRPGPPETSVVGRAGSQSCQLIGPSSAGSCGTHVHDEPVEVEAEVVPAEPISCRARSCSHRRSPPTKRAHRRRVRPSARRAPSVTPSPSRCSRRRLPQPRSTETHGSARARASRIASSSGWQNMFDSGQPERLRSASRPKRSRVSPRGVAPLVDVGAGSVGPGARRCDAWRSGGCARPRGRSAPRAAADTRSASARSRATRQPRCPSRIASELADRARSRRSTTSTASLMRVPARQRGDVLRARGTSAAPAAPRGERVHAASTRPPSTRSSSAITSRSLEVLGEVAGRVAQVPEVVRSDRVSAEAPDVARRGSSRPSPPRRGRSRRRRPSPTRCGAGTTTGPGCTSTLW